MGRTFFRRANLIDGVKPPRKNSVVVVDDERIADVMSLDEHEAIHDHRLLRQCLVVLVIVFAGFVAHKPIPIPPDWQPRLVKTDSAILRG